MKKLICVLLAALLLTGAACAETPGNRLGFEAMRMMYDESENMVLSPLSLAFALAMTAEAGESEAKQEILDALGAESVEAVAALRPQLEEAGLRQANAVFLNGELLPHGQYEDVLSEWFGAKWFEAEEISVDQINRWTEDMTDGMIEKLLERLPDETKLVLANAIAMDAKWAVPFDPEANTDGVFHAPEGDMEAVFMNRTLRTEYAEREEAQLLKLNYRDCGLSLLIALPPEGGVKAVLEGLCAEGMDYFRFGEDEVRVNLSMPKLDVTAGGELSDALRELGIEKAFTELSPDIGLRIGGVTQKARLIFDEEGTRAAAATAIAMATGAMIETPPVEFEMDRPFVFVIAHEGSGAVCFSGIVSNPVGN